MEAFSNTMQNYFNSAIEFSNTMQNYFDPVIKPFDNIQSLWGLAVLIITGVFYFLFIFTFVKTVNKKSKKQIDFFKKNGKYIDGLFIELNNTKEFLRYFIFEKRWKQRVITEFNNFHEDYKDNFVIIKVIEDALCNKLSKRSSIKQIKKIINNNLTDQELSHRYKDYLEELNSYCSAMISRFIILTGSAGNGKTNLLCSTTELIMDVAYPCIFLNARDINITVAEYFYKKLDIPFIIKIIPKDIILWCINASLIIRRKKLFIIIDAINENDLQSFQDSIAEFINEILLYSNFKILLSCRSEYFEHRYNNLFKNKVEIEPLIYDIKEMEYPDRAIEKIYSKYKKYFKFTGRISQKAFDMLSDSLLLMRIFFEVNENSSEYIMTLNKFEIYRKYIEVLKEKTPEIDDLIGIIVNNMIESREFGEVPENKLGLDSHQLTLLRKIADESLLIGRIIKKDEGNIAETEEEMFSFVFDELRDYYISRYLVLYCRGKDKSCYTRLFNLIDYLYEKKLSPLEGILRYSYNFFKDKNETENCKSILANYANNDLSEFINHKNWSIRGLEKPRQEFYDFGISLILDCNKDLFDLEKEYIFEKCKNNAFRDVNNFFNFLCWNQYNKNHYYSFSLFIEFLMNISDFEQLKGVLSVFEGKSDDLINILKKLNEENVADDYYKFLIIWVSFFNNHGIIRDYISKYYTLKTAFDEIESATPCTELKNKVNDLYKNIFTLTQGDVR